MNNISNSLQIETLVDLNSREGISGEVREIWGDERMRESIRKLLRVGATSPRFVRVQSRVLMFLIAPTIQSHEIWNLRQEWGVGKFEGSPNAEARAKAVATVDAMFLELTISVRLQYILQ